ncbi:MAG: metal ABC transporter substrate-binding protein [Nitrospinales bacterium]
MNIKFINFTLVILFGLFGFAPTAFGGLNIVTTTPDIASITREIGGDLVNVHSLLKGTQDSHYIQAKPSFLIKINRADLLIYQGLELEIGWLPLLIQGGRNPKVLPGQPGHLDLSSSIEPINIPQTPVDRSMGDVHPLGNPHYHLDPLNGIFMAFTISDKLTFLDPKNSDQYKKNFLKFKVKIETHLKKWKAQLQEFKNIKIVTQHMTWNYFLQRFDIENFGTIEVLPGIPATAKHLAQLARRMKANNTKIIIQANFFDEGHARLLAQKTNGIALSLPASIGGSVEATNYVALFDHLINKLVKALNSIQKS